MSSRVYDIQGYSLALPHVLFVSAVFNSELKEGWQFNVRLAGDVRLQFKFPNRSDAAIERELFVKALKECP